MLSSVDRLIYQWVYKAYFGIFSMFRTRKRIDATTSAVLWCRGNTMDFESIAPGSIPGRTSTFCFLLV